MSLTKDVKVLRDIPLFAKVKPAKLKLLAFPSERLEYLSGDELFHQDDYGDAAYIILEGEADILVDTPDSAIKIATRGRNDIIGEIAILCDVPRTATVVAHGDLETLRVSKDGFFHLVTQCPQVGIEVMRALAAKLRSTSQALTAARAKLDELEKSSCSG
jgi:CRP/FNR family transcriptional regulator, cyclic AMP receptor protein